MRYYETLFNEMLSQRTDLISWIFCNDSKLDRVVRESTVKRESSWGPARVRRTRVQVWAPKRVRGLNFIHIRTLVLVRRTLGPAWGSSWDPFWGI